MLELPLFFHLQLSFTSDEYTVTPVPLVHLHGYVLPIVFGGVLRARVGAPLCMFWGKGLALASYLNVSEHCD